MKTRIYILLLSLCVFACVSAAGRDKDENVRVANRSDVYEIKARNGSPVSVKNTIVLDYIAERADGTALVVTGYNDHISIDKASAPGAKPQYRSWIPEDLFYTDSRICYFELPLKKGKSARAEFRRTFKEPHQFTSIGLGDIYFTEKLSVEVRVPAELADRIRVSPRNLTDNFVFERKETPDKGVVYTVRGVDISPFDKEEFAVAADISSPRLIIEGLFADVQDFYSFIKGYLPDYNDISPEISALSRRLTANAPDDLAKIDSVAAWVRSSIRYIAVEHGEYALRPSLPDEVLTNRFGDCKGSASLLKALLTSAGLDARIVWIGTAGQVNTDWSELPSLMSGNHMIAAVVMPDTIVYVDGTCKFVPRGHVPVMIRGRQALIEDGNSCMLRDVSTRNSCQASDSLRINFVFNEKAGLFGVAERRFEGDYRALISNAYNTSDVRLREKTIGRIMAAGRSDLRAADILFSEDGFDSRSVTVSAKIIDKNSVKAMGDKLYVDLAPVRLMLYKPFEAEDRRRDALFPLQENYNSEIALQIPEGYNVVSCPKDFSLSDDWFDSSVVYELAGDGRLLCKAKVKMKRTSVPAASVAEWNATLNKILRASASRVVLGKIRE